MPRLYQHKLPVILLVGLPASLLGLAAIVACGLLMHDSLNNNFFAHGNLVFGLLFEAMLVTHILIGLVGLIAFWQWVRADIIRLGPQRQRRLSYRLALVPYGLLAAGTVLPLDLLLYAAACAAIMTWLTIELYRLSRRSQTP